VVKDTVRRLLRGHPGETGLVLHRRTARLPWPGVPGWETVVVTVPRPEQSRAGELASWLDDARLGRESPEPESVDQPRRGELGTTPTWLPLEPGQHTIEISRGSEALRPQTVRLGPGDRFLVAVRPPIWLPFRQPLPARWSLRLLPGEPAR
jgi:hypothetical protein